MYLALAHSELKNRCVLSVSRVSSRWPGGAFCFVWGGHIDSLRKRLARLVDERHTFQATFMRFGKAHLPDGRIKRYMFIVDIVDEHGKHISGHLWMPLQPDDYIWVSLHCGNVIRFDAEVCTYTKGPRNRYFDYGLRRPRNVVRVKQVQGA
jgi:hypothetical protein